MGLAKSLNFKVTYYNPKKNLSSTKAPETGEIDDSPSLDFYELLENRAERIGVEVPGSREDWTKKYEQLHDWDGSADKEVQAMHTEVSLALNALALGLKGDIVIAVSKQPCFLCLTWFTHLNLNSSLSATRFLIPISHMKM
jgi:hypothetical protein